MVEEITTENGWPKPTSIVGNDTDETVVRILAHINRAGKELNDLADFIRMTREHTFVTIVDDATYDLPADFERFQLGTHYDRTSALAFGGPLDAAEWQAIKSGAGVATIIPSYRIKVNSSHNNEFTFETAPSAVNTIVFEYVSNGWVRLAGDSSRTQYFGKSGDTSSDSDISLIDEELVKLWATSSYLETLGFPFAAAQKRAADRFSRVVGRDGGTKILSASGNNIDAAVLGTETPMRGFG
jgi:hypothetical protein